MSIYFSGIPGTPVLVRCFLVNTAVLEVIDSMSINWQVTEEQRSLKSKNLMSFFILHRVIWIDSLNVAIYHTWCRAQRASQQVLVISFERGKSLKRSSMDSYNLSAAERSEPASKGKHSFRTIFQSFVWAAVVLGYRESSKGAQTFLLFHFLFSLLSEHMILLMVLYASW